VGNNLPTILSTAIAGGHPPDMPTSAQPGTMTQYAKQGKLKAITIREACSRQNFNAAWLKLGQVGGKQYAVPF